MLMNLNQRSKMDKDLRNTHVRFKSYFKTS